MVELIYDKDGCPGITKSPVIYVKDGNCYTPVVYFHRPKNVPKEKFEMVVEFLIKNAVTK